MSDSTPNCRTPTENQEVGDFERGVPRFKRFEAGLSDHTARGGTHAVAAQISRILIQLAIAAALARLLSPGDFGLVAMAAALLAFVGIFSDLGLSAATVQLKEIDQKLVSSLFYLNVAMGLVVMAFGIAAAPAAAWFFDQSDVTAVSIGLALSVPVAAAGAQHAALLQRSMRWGPVQWTPVAALLIGGATAIVLAWKGGVGYWALVVQNWVTTAITTASMWTFCEWRPGWRINVRDARPALKFGINLTGFNLVNYFHRQIDNVLIGARWGAVELGFYTRAYQLLTLPIALISGPVGSAVVPALSRLQGEPERWRKAFVKIFCAINVVSCGITAILIASSEPLIRIVYGQNWGNTSRIFTLLSISMFAATPMNAMGWIYMSLGQTSRAFHWSLLVTPFYVVAFAAGLPFGAVGVAAAYSGTVWLAAVPCIAFACRVSPVATSELLRIATPPIVVGVVAGVVPGALLAANLQSPIAQLVAFGLSASALYGSLVLLIIRLDPSYRELYDHLINRLNRDRGR